MPFFGEKMCFFNRIHQFAFCRKHFIFIKIKLSKRVGVACRILIYDL